MITSSAITFVKVKHPLLTEILAQVIPSWAAYTTAFDQCRNQRTKIAEAAKLGRAAGDPVARLTQQLLDGEPFPADLIDGIDRSEHAEAALTRASVVVDQVENKLTAHRDEAVRSAADRILAALHTRLERVVNAARRLKLGSACTADEAVDQDRLAEWSAFVKLRTEHNLIRDAQGQVMRHLALDGAEHIESFAWFTDYAALFPSWNDWRPDGARVAQSRGNEPFEWISGPPWPEDLIDRFRWLLDNPEVRVWVPSSVQLVDAVRSAHRALPQSDSAATGRTRPVDQQRAVTA